MGLRSLMFHAGGDTWKEWFAKLRASTLELNQVMKLGVTRSTVSDEKELSGSNWVCGKNKDYGRCDPKVTVHFAQCLEYVGPKPLPRTHEYESIVSAFLRETPPRALAIHLLKMTFDSESDNDAQWMWGWFEEDSKLAIVMALHPRLGQQSSISALGTEIMRLIFGLGGHVLE